MDRILYLFSDPNAPTNSFDPFVLAITALVFAGVVFSYYHAWTRKKTRSPAEQNISIERITIYPVKSCKGIQVKEATFSKEGLEFDRNWMIADVEKMCQLSARDNRGIKLVMLRPSIHREENSVHGGWLYLHFPEGHEPKYIRAPLRPSPETTRDWETVSDVNLFGSSLRGLVVPAMSPSEPDPSAVLSKYTGHDVKWIMRPHDHLRNCADFDELTSRSQFDYSLSAEEKALNARDWGARTVFADICPFMIASTASLEDAKRSVSRWRKENGLESETEDIKIERWRPNWLVSGVETAFGEDEWREGEISGMRFIFPLQTPRCMFPNVDPDTGVRDPHMPHKVMIKYRRVIQHVEAFKNKYCFGVYAIPAINSGVIRVGDRIKITKWVGGEIDAPTDKAQ